MIEEQTAKIRQGQIHNSGSGKKKKITTVNTEFRGLTTGTFLPAFLHTFLF